MVKKYSEESRNVKMIDSDGISLKDYYVWLGNWKVNKKQNKFIRFDTRLYKSNKK